FFLLLLHPPISTLFPYTTLFRSSASSERWKFAIRFAGVKCTFASAVSADGLTVAAFAVHIAAADEHAASSWGASRAASARIAARSEEHTSELQSPYDLVCRLLLE